MARALLALLTAAAAAPSLGTLDVDTAWRTRRDAVVVADAAGTAGTADTADTGVEEEPAVLAADGEGAAWRELWYASLEAARREPALNATPAHVAAQLGGRALLHCPVQHLGERGISWVRLRDWHIISSGLLMYTNDERFQVLHADGSDDWVLQIKWVAARDAGAYECQVSTRRGSLTRRVHLHVNVPDAFILGSGEHHVHAGSPLTLVCIIEKSPVPPQYVFWYHNGRMVNYDAGAGVSVHTATSGGGGAGGGGGGGGVGALGDGAGVGGVADTARTRSTLQVAAAQAQHAGNYTCSGPPAPPASIYVYVSDSGDKMAATLRGGAPPAHPAPLPACLALLALLVARSR